MWLSIVGRCALRTMVDLALHCDQGPVPCQDIAKRQGISDQDLSQLLFKLEQAGLVLSVGDPGSAYTLARDAAGISAHDILQAVEGTHNGTSGVEGRPESARRPLDFCPTGWPWGQLGQTVGQILDSITVADLCHPTGSPLPHLARSPDKTAAAGGKVAEETRGRFLSLLDSLEAAYALQQSIVDGLAEPVMVIGTDYRVKLMNWSACEFSSVAPDASEPLLCYRISHRRDTPCDGIAHPCPLRQVSESGQPITVVHEHYQADGGRRLVEVIASPLWGADGTCQGIVESARDITERVRAEEALQQYAERLRALAEQLAEVAEAERQRLARELHDQVGQNLTALGINLNIIRTQMPGDVGPVVQSRLDDSLLLVQQTAERIRDVMANLRPPVLDDYGLLAALHWYAEQFTQRTNIIVTVENGEPVPRLDQRVETGLFRIVQEALTNVAKHAQASHVTVTVETSGDALRLLIVDDGIGFDLVQLAEPGRGRGWGLLTMAERAEAVGGYCIIESCPDLGTQVIVEVPR